MFKNLLYLILVVFLSSCSNKISEKEFPVYEPNWESLNQHEIPEWLLDAKLGLYGHWGVYSVPAFQTEWYGRIMYDKYTRGEKAFNHHIETYGNQADFGYKDFIKDFKAEKFDPDVWADIIVKSGAKYAGITAVHHDGFCLWDSEYTRWDSKDMGPERDLYGELVGAIREADPEMKILTCFHHYRTYGWFYSKDSALLEQGKAENWDIFDPEYSDFYRNPQTELREDFMIEWENKIKEVIDNYQPDVIWFDGGNFRGAENEPRTLEVLSYFYNTQSKKGSEVEVVNKKSNFHPDFGLRNFEKGGNRGVKTDFDWADDLNIANRAWSYTHDINYRTSNQIIDGFIDRVSRGGGLMLSIAPMADGAIPEEQINILTDLGDWLKINGEGIYGTRRWKIETEGPNDKFMEDGGKKIMWNFKGNTDASDIRFTKKGNQLFAFILDWPADGKVVIKSLSSSEKIAENGIHNVKLLGYDGALNWQRDEAGLTIDMPQNKIGNYAYGFEIVTDGKLVE
ncbi:MAG: alpha-L-fucosidase [Bacteroidales bacterium]|nr:alpha-L-fucosidase [Bacteroidales bacterium]